MKMSYDARTLFILAHMPFFITLKPFILSRRFLSNRCFKLGTGVVATQPKKKMAHRNRIAAMCVVAFLKRVMQARNSLIITLGENPGGSN